MRQDVLSGVERRRRWWDAERRSILAEVGEGGATVADVARRHDIGRQHIYQWRTEFRRRGERFAEASIFLPVEIAATNGNASSAGATTCVEIVLANGWRLRGIEGLSLSGLAQLIQVLEDA